MKVRNEKPVEQIVAAIGAMDLDPIKFKLMDADEGEGWSREQVDRIETAYRQFLTLLVKHPESTIAPSKEVDKFWHGHILDTMKYAEDCESVFGYFLHHFPYFGMRGQDDAAQLDAAGRETRRLMAAEFGPAAANKPSYCFAAKKADAAYCSASKPSYCFAAKESQEAAYCFATKPSYCFAAKQADQAAYCFAAKPANEASYCFAAKPSYCFAAVKADAAYCFAAKKTEAAYCFAARQAADAAYCFASTPSKARVDIRTRPTLAMAA